MRRIAVAVVGFAGSALVAFFFGGPAMLADGGDAERSWMVAAASVTWATVGTLAGWVAGSPRAGLSVAAGALPIVALLVAAEPGAWRVGVGLLMGIGAGIAAGTLAGRLARTVHGNA